MARLATRLSWRDRLGTIAVRSGLRRNSYLMVPGLYCLGEPDGNSPVLVTGNYKLSVDTVRQELAGHHLWLLVVDTRGINVWCAGGKGTFSAAEVAYQVQNSGLAQLVNHRQLILPQLSANGVRAGELKKLCGFLGRFGPILATDLPEYLRRGEADEAMRSVTFRLSERAVLIPVEICLLWKKLLLASLLFFLLSGISPEFFTVEAALRRGTTLALANAAAIFAGAIATPLLLPWLPFRQFWLKGAVLGLLAGLIFVTVAGEGLARLELLALLLWIGGCASYLAMCFTGSTPYTSLSGVAKEMRRGLPFQIGTALLALLLWLAAPFF